MDKLSSWQPSSSLAAMPSATKLLKLCLHVAMAFLVIPREKKEMWDFCTGKGKFRFWSVSLYCDAR